MPSDERTTGTKGSQTPLLMKGVSQGTTDSSSTTDEYMSQEITDYEER